MDIIIKKSSSSMRFQPHFNHATGRFYHTSSDYVSDLKKKGLEPYRPDQVQNKLKSKEPYKPSEWAKKMVAVGKRQVEDCGKTSGSFNAEMSKHLKTSIPDKIARQTKGGIYSE